MNDRKRLLAALDRAAAAEVELLAALQEMATILEPPDPAADPSHFTELEPETQ